MDIKKLMASALLLSTLASFTGCSGGGGGSSTYGAYMSPSASVTAFVNALNSVDGTYLNQSAVMLYENETLRSLVPGEEQWFVIWDEKFGEYKSVSLQYVRSIVYYDYYSNSSALAQEFRDIETTDILNGDLNGDFFGDNYEVVDGIGFGIYQGRNSGMLYDDDEETEDVVLEMKDAEQGKIFKQAALYSSAFKMPLSSAMSLISIEKQAKTAVKKGEMTNDDLNSLSKSFEKFTGKSMNDFAAAMVDAGSKATLIKDVAKKIGMDEQKLEERIVPEIEKMFGL